MSANIKITPAAKIKTADTVESKPRSNPRKRVVPIWRSRKMGVAFSLLMVFGIVASGWWATNSGLTAKTVEQARWQVIAASSALGFTVEEVLVTGRGETRRAELMDMLAVERGAPILAYDFRQAKARVEDLPWVQTARLERLLPDTLVLHLIERRPLALWQQGGSFSLIDEEGEVITTQGLDRFQDLMHVVGRDAPQNVGPLLELLETQPEIRKLVVAAVRIGGRRWDLRLEGGIDVRLPELGAPEALARLAQFEKQKNLLSREIRILDLRMPDRVILRREPQVEFKPQLPEQNET